MRRPAPLLLLAVAFVAAACSAQMRQGRVVDPRTRAGIPDATITCGSRTVQSAADGTFGIDCSAERILVRAPGYRQAEYVSGQMGRNATLLLEPFSPRALYLTVYGVGSRPLREAALALIRKGYANALVIDIKGDRGIVPYPSSVPLTSSPGARAITTIRNLPELVRSLREQNIYLIARIVVFKDDPLAGARRDLAVTRRDGTLYRDREGLAWTDPFRPEVREYNIAIAVEAARAGFNEIQFDYVRFPDVSAALRFAEPTSQESRRRAIQQFLREARQRLAPYNTFLAIDIFGYVCWNTTDTGIGQVIEDLAPIVDYVSPMLYPSSFQYGIPGYRDPVNHPYEIVSLSLKKARGRVSISPVRFRPWVQAFRDYAFDRRAFDARAVQQQINAARDFGADGYMLWNAHNRYEPVLGAGADATARSKLAGRGNVSE